MIVSFPFLCLERNVINDVGFCVGYAFVGGMNWEDPDGI